MQGNFIETKLFTEVYNFYKLYYNFSFTLPKKDRFGVGLRCETLILTLLENVIIAQSAKANRKKTALESASEKLDVIKVFIRFYQDMGIIEKKTYLLMQENLAEIGRLLGGWIRVLK